MQSQIRHDVHIFEVRHHVLFQHLEVQQQRKRGASRNDSGFLEALTRPIRAVADLRLAEDPSEEIQEGNRHQKEADLAFEVLFLEILVMFGELSYLRYRHVFDAQADERPVKYTSLLVAWMRVLSEQVLGRWDEVYQLVIFEAADIHHCIFTRVWVYIPDCTVSIGVMCTVGITEKHPQEMMPFRFREDIFYTKISIDIQLFGDSGNDCFMFGSSLIFEMPSYSGSDDIPRKS